MLPGRASALGLVFLAAVACGGGGSSSSLSASTATTTGPSATTAPQSVRTDVPDAVLRDVGTGTDVNLRALGLPERPTLYWFWAPH